MTYPMVIPKWWSRDCPHWWWSMFNHCTIGHVAEIFRQHNATIILAANGDIELVWDSEQDYVIFLLGQTECAT